MTNTYGDWLRDQREAAGLTQQQLANAAVMTRSHISHIEAGRRVPSKEDARRLDRALNTGNVLSSFLPQDESVVADYFEAARQLEQQATVIREFALSFVPGILQTETYARAVLSVGFPPVSEEECDRSVVARLERSKILADPGNARSVGGVGRSGATPPGRRRGCHGGTDHAHRPPGRDRTCACTRDVVWSGCSPAHAGDADPDVVRGPASGGLL